MSTSEQSMDLHREQVNLPPRIFLYSIDQVAHMLDMSVPTVKRTIIFFHDRNGGRKPLGLMGARNIASRPGDPAIWRVAENELIRWAKHKGFVFKPEQKLVR